MSLDIQELYRIFLQIMLRAENTSLKHIQSDLHETIKLPMPLLPLLNSAVHILHSSMASLPLYLHQYAPDDLKTDYVKDVISRPQWFLQEIYPELLKLFYQQNLRIQPTIETEKSLPIHAHKFIFDAQSLTAYPAHGIDISDYNFTPPFPAFIIGPIQEKHQLTFQELSLVHKPIHIAPRLINHGLGYEKFMRYLGYFADTALANNISLSLPFILSYFDYGLAPISFYTALLHSPNPHHIIQNAICLMNLPPVNSAYPFAQQALPHISPCQKNKPIRYNYLFLLSELD